MRSPSIIDMTTKQNFHSIQQLRGIAALLVVAFHLHMLSGIINLKSSFLEMAGRFGEIGVDIFFVLSGFLMIYTTRKKPPGFATAIEFMRARITRIAPLYWVLTIAFAIALFAMPTHFDAHPFDPQHLWKSLLFIPAYNHLGQPVPVIYTGWTLNYEMFFYVIFAMAICFTRKHAFTIIITTFASLSLFSLTDPSSLLLQTYTSPILLEFAAGCAIALVYDRKAVHWKLALLCLLAGLCLIPVLATPALHRSVHYGIPATLIVFGALMLEKDGKWFQLRTLHLIGNSSYSLYLTHIFTLPIVLRIIRKLGIVAVLHPTIATLIIIAICVLVGHLTYIIVEKRFEVRVKTNGAGRTVLQVPQ